MEEGRKEGGKEARKNWRKDELEEGRNNWREARTD